MLSCRDGTLYTGMTNDLALRLKTHNLGKGARYTKSRLPVKVVYTELVKNRSEALRREAEIKGLGRVEKLRLCENR
jgi:putative endonuclease